MARAWLEMGQSGAGWLQGTRAWRPVARLPWAILNMVFVMLITMDLSRTAVHSGSQ